MVFNWFRRQSSDTATPQQQEVTAPVEAEVEPEDVASSEEPSQAAASDYLRFAKAAYKNIQKQQPLQQAVTDQTSEIAEPEATDTVPVAEALPLLALTDRATTSASLPNSDVSVDPSVTESTDDRGNEEGPGSVTDTVSNATSELSADPTETSNEDIEAAPLPFWARAEADRQLGEVFGNGIQDLLPFWARAEADRQARLERLKQNAIEESSAVNTSAAIGSEDTRATATAGVPAAVPDIAFDEGFLWSAEVLAAQGRRPEGVSIEEITWLKKLRQGLDKTRRNIVNQLKAIVGQGPLNQAAVMEIEALLLQADVGVEATDYIINALQNQLKQEVLPPEQAIAYLKQILRDILDRPLKQSYDATFAPEKDTLNIWLITGVNGAGKTTTVGKIAHIAEKSGYRCLIGAADTFRAAAVEQLKIWGSRSGIEVVANPGKNTDPAAVVFDAITAAQARTTELLLIDTAGRLQNKKNLMDELSKIRRIVDKKAPNARVESLLVLDATLGQNGLRQASVFAEVAQLSGVILTKLDGTAKGGVALAVVQQLGLPIRFIGAGEGIEDLRPFSSYEFIEALLSS